MRMSLKIDGHVVVLMSSRLKRRAVVRLSGCKWRFGDTGITVPTD